MQLKESLMIAQYAAVLIQFAYEGKRKEPMYTSDSYRCFKLRNKVKKYISY